jgi:hypothetical protein
MAELIGMEMFVLEWRTYILKIVIMNGSKIACAI